MIIENSPAGIAAAERRNEEAESLAQARLRENPADVGAITVLALLRIRQGDNAEAERLLTQIVQLAPNWAMGHYNRGFFMRETARIGEAVKEFQAATVLHPPFAEGWHQLGMTLVWKVGWPSGVAPGQDALRKAAELEPDSAQILYDCANALLMSSKEAEAEPLLRRALEMQPNWPDAAYALGTTLIELDRAEEAVPFLEIAAADPNQHSARRELERVKHQRRSRRTPLARYPRETDEFADFEKLFDRYVAPAYRDERPLINMATQIFTLGSCFANFLAQNLRAFGMHAEYVNMAEELNSTFANRHFLDWVRNGATNVQTERIQEFYFENFGSDYRDKMRATIESAKVVIYSLGVAPCFFDAATGEYVLTLGENMQAALVAHQFKFRTTTVTENVTNLLSMFDDLRAFNPNSHIFLTVSPVPLKATFEFQSALIADCVSKSTLRVAAHEVMQQALPNVHYWPSYEMVKWVGCHTGPVYGAEDGSSFHVNQELVKRNVALFLQVYGDNEVMQANRRAQEARQPIQELAASVSIA
ncbi:MAG: GSCFA domain-containing protein [Candidatus Eremiobacteraeota bacterium]|nr:GSCFA domain-containing protein [Candidatus Eremiobacteraeota bacterium]